MQHRLMGLSLICPALTRCANPRVDPWWDPSTAAPIFPPCSPLSPPPCPPPKVYSSLEQLSQQPEPKAAKGRPRDEGRRDGIARERGWRTASPEL